MNASPSKRVQQLTLIDVCCVVSMQHLGLREEGKAGGRCDAENTLQSKWSGEVASASLELSLKYNLAGNPPHDIFQGELLTPKTDLPRAV